MNEYQEEKEHLLKLRKEYINYLRKLEIKAAKFGLSVPVHIEQEIDEIKDKVEDLKVATEEVKKKIDNIRADLHQLQG
ncbi:MAG: hypothetical protein U0401_26130 [Anaerolineae bacterium]